MATNREKYLPRLTEFNRPQVVPRAYIQEAPYITSMVDLAEGPRIIGRIEKVRYEDLIPGMSLKIGFGQLDEKIPIFYFMPKSG